MTLPRWAHTQREVEASLAREPKTIRAVAEETGLSRATVYTCINRAQVHRQAWPAVYTLLLSAFSDVAAVPEAAPEVIVQHIVEPLSIPVKELGPKWQEGRSKLGQEVAAIDLAALNLQTAIRHLEVEAASILGAIVALKSVKDGPDWREQIGLAP